MFPIDLPIIIAVVQIVTGVLRMVVRETRTMGYVVLPTVRVSGVNVIDSLAVLGLAPVIVINVPMVVRNSEMAIGIL